jgi:PAS domain S-box-containing protein
MSPSPRRQRPERLAMWVFLAALCASLAAAAWQHHELRVESAAALALLASLLTYFYAADKRRRDELTEEQARRAAIIEGTSDSVIGETLDGLITDWNPGAERTFGFAASHAVGKAVADLILPENRAHEDLALCEAIARGESPLPFETTRQRADRTLVDVSVSVSPIVDARGRRIGFAKTIRDISAAKRAEQQIKALNATLEQQVLERTSALEAARRDLNNILDAAPSLISYWDRALENRFANIAHESWFQRDSKQLPGTHASELFGAHLDAMRPPIEQALLGKARSETLDITLPGSAEPKHCVVHYLPDTVAGEVRGFYLFVYDTTPQRRAQDLLARALRENQALLSTIHEHTIVSITDATGRILDVNPHFVRASGYAREELIGSNHSIVRSSAHVPAFWAEMWQSIRSGKPWRAVIQNRKKNGEAYFVDSIVAPFKSHADESEKYISIGFDITASKRAEVELTRTTERIGLATHAARIGIWELDMKTERLSWDDWMYHIYGRPQANDLPYAAWVHSLHPDDSERARNEFADALAGRRTFDTEFRIVQPSGEQRHIKAVAHVVRDAAGAPLHVTGVNLDITERKRAELELVSTSTLLQNVLEAAAEVSLIATDPNLTIKVFNGGAERLLGYRADELIERATPLLIHDAEELRIRAKELSSASGQTVQGAEVLIHPLALETPREWTYVKKDGGRVTVSLVFTAMRNDDGHLFGYLGVAHDVTRQKQYEASLEDAMRKAESANRAKSQFLANMSHEIRTPMNAVIGLSHLLAGTKLDAEQSSFTAKIQVASKSLLAVINDVLDLSKIEAGELVIERAPFPLLETLRDLRDVFELEARNKGILLELAVAPEVPHMLEGDVTRLKQILTNLLSNALKFTESGRITLRASLEGGSAASAPDVHFEVSDTGIGISPEQQRRLFAPFAQADASTTRRFGGTGLGLSIVKRLSELMGGRVELSSKLGVGSTFSVALPFDLVLVSVKPSRAAPPELVKTALLGVRLLVVDDSEINLFVARKILQNEGALVTVASNGRDALDRLRAKPSGYDAVLMDVQMPVMDGHEAASRIRGELGLTKLPIIALTADARTSERRQALLSGMDDFLSKPIEAPALIHCLARYLPLFQREVDGQHDSMSAAGTEAPAAADDWPLVDGLDTDEVRDRLACDRELLITLLGCFLRDFNEAPHFPGASSGPALSEYTARVHRLSGTAGQLGAKSIHELCGRIETLCTEGRLEPVADLARRLETELTRLLRSAAQVLRANDVALGHTGAALPTEAQLEHLLSLLRNQSLSSLAEIRKLRPSLVTLLGERRYRDFQTHVENLEFVDAARILAPRPSMLAV